MNRIDLSSAVSPIVSQAIADRVFPGAVIEVGRAKGPISSYAAGTLTYAPDSAQVSLSTIYDLESEAPFTTHELQVCFSLLIAL